MKNFREWKESQVNEDVPVNYQAMGRSLGGTNQAINPIYIRAVTKYLKPIVDNQVSRVMQSNPNRPDLMQQTQREISLGMINAINHVFGGNPMQGNRINYSQMNQTPSAPIDGI